jgi:hypothetical protein
MSTQTLARRRLLTVLGLLLFSGAIAARWPAREPRALPNCEPSSDADASLYSDFINKIVVLDDDTASRRIMKFSKATSATWVTDEVKCQKAIATLDTKFWTAARGGPIYLMQVGTDYAAFPGDAKSKGNSLFFHFDSNFNILASGAW